MTDDELREQLALYAVGALDDDERTELEDVLRTRPDLRTELDELLEAATLMADAEREAPPAGLRANVLDLIANEPQLPVAPAAPVAPVVPIGAARKRNRWIAAGAAVVAAAAVAIGVVVVTRDDGGTDQVAAVVAADDAQTIQMPGTLPGITIVHSPSENAAVILADDVPVPEGDRVYELWAINDDVAARAATFRPNADGTLSFYAPNFDPATAEQWAITEEPAGGSDTPTPPILNATA